MATTTTNTDRKWTKKLGEFGRERTVGIWGKCGKSEDGEGVGVNGDEVERNGRK